MVKKLLFIGIGVAALSCGGALQACPCHSTPIAQQEPDNTNANKQGGATADQQKETPADRELAQKIRKSIANDKSLSTYAHNVRVIVRDGMVTLKGSVQSEDEKKSIGTKAAEVAGADKVQNELTVKS